MANLGGAPAGNQNAAKGKRWQKALERALAHKFGDVETGLFTLAKKFIDLADSAEEREIFKEIADRFDGKPAQAVELAGPDGAPLPQFTGIVAVNPDAK
jgi:hypothetical protein